MRRRGLLLFVIAGCLAGCKTPAAGPAPTPSSPPLVDEARSLIAAGDADGALARLASADPSDPEVLYVQGVAWAAKGETVPAPAAGSIKPEDEQALAFFEKASAARPELAAAHLGTAEVLAPYALRTAAAEKVVTRKVPRRSDRSPATEAPSPVAEVRPERVIQAFRRAAQADRTSIPIVEAWIEFATKAGRVEEADTAFQELLRRDKENAAPFVRYGDFLLAEKKDWTGAIAQYSQALIWKAADPEPRSKIADIYLAQAQGHYDRKEYATAAARLADAKRYVDAGSPQQAHYEQQAAQLAAIRAR